MLAVTLSPPADLELLSVSVSDEWTTGETVVIDVTVTNSGGGTTFEPSWTDLVVRIESCFDYRQIKRDVQRLKVYSIFYVRSLLHFFILS